MHMKMLKNKLKALEYLHFTEEFYDILVHVYDAV